MTQLQQSILSQESHVNQTSCHIVSLSLLPSYYHLVYNQAALSIYFHQVLLYIFSFLQILICSSSDKMQDNCLLDILKPPTTSLSSQKSFLCLISFISFLSLVLAICNNAFINLESFHFHFPHYLSLDSCIWFNHHNSIPVSSLKDISSTSKIKVLSGGMFGGAPT